MKALVLIALLIAAHVVSATLDIEKIKEIKSTAAEQLQTLKEKASTGLQQLKEKASSSLQDLTEKASDGLHHLVDEIDVKNLYKLDILDVIPTLKKKYKLIKDLYNKPDAKVNVIHIYGDDLNSHFDHAKVFKVKKYHPAHLHALPHLHQVDHHDHHPGHHHHYLKHVHVLPEHYHISPYPLKRLGY